MPAYALSETLYSTLALAAAFVMGTLTIAPLETVSFTVSENRDAHSFRPIVSVTVSGILTGLAILVRPAMVFFLPFALAWLVLREPAAARRAGIERAVTFVLAAILCVAPWTIRNHHVYGRWIAVASEGGVTFWTGNHPLAIGEGDLAANPDLKRAELAFRAARPGLTPERLEPLYYGDALSWMRWHPADWLRLMVRKAFYTVVPTGPSYALHSARYRIASVASYLLVLCAAVAGAWRWRAARTVGRGPGPVALWLMATSTVAAGLVFFPQERFRIPVVDPALIVTAALAAGLQTHGRTRRHADL
jgi:4-amino-4-deoxy-L-arabinose transferase-like glycosyltransferase